MDKKACLSAIVCFMLLSAILLSSCGNNATSVPVPRSTVTVETEAVVTSGTKDYASIPPAVKGEVLYIPFPVRIKVDGDLSDWEGIPSQYVDYGSLPSSNPNENGSFTFSVASDMDNLYITMQMPDANIGTDFWNEDSMEFYMNASDDLNANAYGLKIFQANINAADIGNTDPNALTITGVFSSDAHVQGYVFKTEKGWGFEAALALKDLLVPEHGREVGFQAQINGASALDRDVKLIWSKYDTSDLSWQSPNLFGRALFFELGRDDVPQASHVEAPMPTPEPAVIPPLVSVNQVGYFVKGQKIASAVLDSTSEVEWQLINSSGEEVLGGGTTVGGSDAASGDFLHFIDFSTFTTPGEGYRILAGGLESAPFAISNEIYSQLKNDALAYFYYNRSGIPIEADFAGEAWARPAGHITDDEVTCFKGMDAAGNDWPGCGYTLNVRGGWYDAGDFGKYVVNGGITAWTLMNLYERFPEAYPDGSLSIPEKENGVSDLLDEARWEMEFLLAMQVPQGEPLAGMAHHKMHDRRWEPIPVRPPTEVDNNLEHNPEKSGRYLYPPSTAATLNLAASAAQCARIWKEIDPAFSQRCLLAAETAWKAALANPTLFAGNTPGEGGGNYDDMNVSDEFYWAASELFITTGKDEYKDHLLESNWFARVQSFDWGNTAALGTLSLVMVENDLPQDKLTELKSGLLAFADELLDLQKRDGYGVLLKGEYIWGTHGTVLNNMMLTGIAYDLTGNAKYLDAMRLSMDYLMGRNSLNQSFVSGYGTYPILHPHHRFWANDPANGFPPPPPGALSGGPNANPVDPTALEAGLLNLPPAKRFLDEIGSFSTNEVAINWNAPLAWAVTYLDQVGK